MCYLFFGLFIFGPLMQGHGSSQGRGKNHAAGILSPLEIPRPATYIYIYIRCSPLVCFSTSPENANLTSKNLRTFSLNHPLQDLPTLYDFNVSFHSTLNNYVLC